MTAVQIILGAAVVASWGYHAAALVGAMKWKRKRYAPQPHPPAVSLLIPVYGTDPEQAANFAAFCAQDYPEYQILFGALDAHDVGLETARRIQEKFPSSDIVLVRGGDIVGANRKVCNLLAMLPHAKHDLIVLCDSDMRVTPGYLRRIAAPFTSLSVGMVTCLYRAKDAQGFAAQLEALGIGADFVPSVLTANLGGIRFAFGATVAVWRDVLEQMGGLEAVVNNLADDYLLGSLCRHVGRDLVLSDYLTETVLGEETLPASWARRLRWAKTVRAVQPTGWAGSFVTHALVLSLLFGAGMGFAPLGLAAVGITLLLRFAFVGGLAAGVTRDKTVLRALWLLPLSDLLAFTLWLCSYIGNSIEWRGTRYRLKRGGALEPQTES